MYYAHVRRGALMVLRLWHAPYNETTTRRTEPLQMCETDDHENIESVAAIDGIEVRWLEPCYR